MTYSNYFEFQRCDSLPEEYDNNMPLSRALLSLIGVPSPRYEYYITRDAIYIRDNTSIKERYFMYIIKEP